MFSLPWLTIRLTIIVWTFTILFPTTFTLTINVTRTLSSTLVLGSNAFTLTCVIDSQGADVYATVLARRREGEGNYTVIISFPAPGSNNSVTYQDTGLVSRTTVVRPAASNLTASVTFNDTVCTDKASYRWTVTYYDTQTREATGIIDITTLKALSTFQTDGQVTHTPTSTNFNQGDVVTFACQGNVGNVPIGELVWYVVKPDNITRQTQGVTTNPPTAEPTNPCSYRRSSSLTLTMTSLHNGAAVRCTAHQDVRNETGNGYKETGIFNVKHPPTNVTIVQTSSSPGDCVTSSDTVTLNCTAVSNPDPALYYWSVPYTNFTVTGTVLQLESLGMGHNGTYTCIALNTVAGRNYTANTTVDIIFCIKCALTITSTAPINGSYVMNKAQPETLRCTCRGGHPTPTVVLLQGWRRGAQLPGTSVVTQDGDGTYTVTLSCPVTPSRDDDLYPLLCRAYWRASSQTASLVETGIIMKVDASGDTSPGSPARGPVWGAVAAALVAVGLILVLIVLNLRARCRLAREARKAPRTPS